MYDSAQWQRTRQRVLSSQPLCQACLLEGRVSPAEEIDHVFPWRQIGLDAFYVNLFQSLCHEHHSAKTQLEQRGVFRHYIDVPRDYTLPDYELLVRTGGLSR